MNFTPPLPILSALGAALLLPVVLAGLSHGPWKVPAPGRRFVLAAALVLAGWGLSLPALRPLAPAALPPC
jgi:hypothetical protein